MSTATHRLIYDQREIEDFTSLAAAVARGEEIAAKPVYDELNRGLVVLDMTRNSPGGYPEVWRAEREWQRAADNPKVRNP